jgi:hypothetical protein
MRQVSKDEFHRVIGPKDVHTSPNTTTHETLFKTPAGYVKGMTKCHSQTGAIISYHLP